MDRAITLVVIDDHPQVRAALKVAIEMRTRFVVAGEASDGLSGLELVRRLQPEVVLVDFRLPLLRGDEVVRIIRRRWPGVRVVAMSSSAEPDAMHAMLTAGAVGYLVKGEPVDDLEAIAGGGMRPRPHGL